jgi:hypothetical protein
LVKLSHATWAGVVLLASAGALAQPRLTCASDSSGRSWCVDTGAIRGGAGGTLSAPLYLGNDRVAHPVGYVVRVDCRTESLEFVASGRPFWAGHFDTSSIAAKLGTAMCG